MSRLPIKLRSQDDFILAPSILSADLLQIKEQVLEVEHAGAGLHHIDVMDGHFVPPLTFGPSIVSALGKVTRKPLDVHLMISNPEQRIDDYVAAGAQMLSFHIEATHHSHRLIQQIQSQGVAAGVALNPGTAVSHLDGLLEVLDYVLLMSVNPGWGGQSFINQTLKKCRKLSDKIARLGRQREVMIEVDGGIHAQTLPLIHSCGARIFVAGSAVYDHDDPGKAVSALLGSVEAGARVIEGH